MNILLEKWETPHEIPPFDRIKPEDFVPAIREAINNARQEIQIIEGSKSKATFENTIIALEESARRLNIISATLFNLNSSETNKEIQAAVQEASRILTEFSNDISLNKKLFTRVKQVYNSDIRKNLNIESRILLDNKFRDFKRGGAELKGINRDRFRKITEELSVLSVQFEENLLSETNSFILHLESERDLKGLPENLIEAAAEEAVSRGTHGWVFTLHAPSYIPFMQNSENRELREKIFRAYSSRCFKENKNSNTGIVKKIVNLRLELAKLLGFDSYADYILEDRMAGSADKVNSFLTELSGASRPFALKDYDTITRYAHKLGHTGNVERWDWPFYAEKLKKELYSIDDEALRPFFRLEKAEEAIFKLAGTLYGLSFIPADKAPYYHPEVKTYNVINEEGRHLSVLMVDYHPRKGKSGGAWMTAYREQYKTGNKDIRPLISIVMNFNKATKNKPSLLSHNELTTLLHEFGHALHGMLSDCTYESLSGTNVKRDFVELPSQIMENWAYEKEWLDSWASHYKTGKKIPVRLINNIKSSLTFNEGYACNRQLGFAFLDMAWHSITEYFEGDIDSFEKDSDSKTELFSPVPGTNQSCAFGHLFSGGYAAGYYGYKWAEVLDADAFSQFKHAGIFDRKTADRFRQNILEKGGSDDPVKLYKNFRGSEPLIDALLERSGFVKR